MHTKKYTVIKLQRLNLKKKITVSMKMSCFKINSQFRYILYYMYVIVTMAFALEPSTHVVVISDRVKRCNVDTVHNDTQTQS